MSSNAFMSDLLASIAERGRALLGGKPRSGDPAQRVTDLIGQCEALLSGSGEASGIALARDMLDLYAGLDRDSQLAFFRELAQHYGPDREEITRSLAAWQNAPSDESAATIHFATEPRRQELFRRLNRAPGATSDLVAMRADLLKLASTNKDIAAVDRDLSHLLGSWFNRGFLVLRRIDWSSPANVLEKVIRYEAVHQIHDWNDLRRRIDPEDRRCYAFFHPAMVDEPLIFVEVALTETIPGAIGPLLAEDRSPVPLARARTAVFYSISNCQRGLGGISFGNFLIKQVVEELRRDLPKLDTFVTLSPVPGFMAWLRKGAETGISDEDRPLLNHLDRSDWIEDAQLVAQLRPILEPAAATYFLKAKAARNRPVDPVARFHLGNGARLERINWLGDVSPKGLREAAGLMVNYLYDLDDIEQNHEAFANTGEIMASSAVRKLLKTEGRRYLPISLG